MGIPIVRGRDFREGERAGAGRVTIISESLARAYFPGEDPIGRRLALDSWTLPGEMAAEIVGVAGDVRHAGFSGPGQPMVYQPLSQRPLPESHFVLRFDGDVLSYAGAVREAVGSFDAALPIYDLAPLEERVSASLAAERLRAVFVGAFATIALLLAATGLYGVLQYVTALRTRELGIRMALGADARDLRMLVLGLGMRWTLAGLAVGTTAAASMARLLENLLFGIEWTDLPTFLAVTTILLLTALAASWLPARRATRISPACALRSD